LSQIIVPKFEPEVIEATARKLFNGNKEKVATTRLNHLMVEGIKLSSRYDKAHELEEMGRMVMAVPERLRASIFSIWCDSKCGRCYTVELIAALWLRSAEELATFLTRGSSGHDGMRINYCDESVDIPPDWFELDD